MRKFSLLVIALLLARYGVIVLTESQPLASYMVRDALILGGIALLLFVAQAPAWSSDAPGRASGADMYYWPLAGRFFVALGFGLALAAALWMAWAEPGGLIASGPRQAVLGLWITAVLAFWLGALWPGPPTYTRPRYRWELDAAGRYVRRVLHGQDATAHTGYKSGGGWALLLLAAVTLVAAGVLRLGQLTELPPACLGSECTRALALTEAGRLGADQAAWMPDSFFHLLAAFISRLTGDGLLSLRLAAAVFACALLPMVYGAARVYTRAGGAAVAVIALTLSPWHLWAARLSHEWIAVPVLVGWSLWAGSRALRNQALGWWAALGLGLGGLLIEAPELRFITLVWALLATLLGLLAGQRAELPWSARLVRLTLVLIGMLTVALPGLVWQGNIQAHWAPREFRQTLGDLILALIQPALVSGPLIPAMGPGMAWLSPLFAAAALLGLAYLLRHAVQLPALLVASGCALWILGVLGLDWAALGPVGALLPLLPFLFMGIGVAADVLFATFQHAWRPLIPPRRALAVGLALVWVVALWRLPMLIDALGEMNQELATTADVAIGQYLGQCLNAPADTLCDYPSHEEPPLIFVPASVLSSPSARLLVGSAIQDARVRALDVTRDLLPGGARPGQGRVYFAPLENQQLLELLQQIYPEADAIAPATDAGPTLFVVFRVTPHILAARQGLQGAYAQGAAFVVATAADRVERDGPLAFAWADAPPLPRPFSVAWEGSLLVPEAGIYEFMVDASGPESSPVPNGAAANLPPLSMQLDDRLVLDSSAGLTMQRIVLAQGPYRLRLYLRVDDGPAALPDLAVRWRPPGQEFQPIPRDALFSPPLPQLGLLGTYYAGNQWQGPTLTQRKDLILDPAVDLPTPYSVRWEGKLAATRAGEYLFAVSGDGLTQILVDGRFLLDYAPGRDVADEPGFAQAGIYLPRGWRQIEIRHAPSGPRPNLRILWQPPGSGPELLRSRYLLPLTGDVSPGEIRLPPLPELWDARLGDDTFALSYMLEMVEREVGLPPAALPALPVTEVWRFAQCGSGPAQLNAPHGVAIDTENGRVYVADTGNRRVAVFELATGAPLAAFAAPDFDEPTDIAIFSGNASQVENGDDATASVGEVFVLDAVAHPIFRLDPRTGDVAPLSLETGFYRPRGFDIDENGVFWVADTGGARVAAIDGDGQLLTQIGGHATALGRGQPVDVLAINGARWTVTAEDGRLWSLETSGSIPAIQRVNTLDGPHFAGLPNGSFLLTDPAGRGFTLHAPSGEPLRRFADPNAFVHPTGIAAAQQDAVVAIAVVDSSACGLSLWHMHTGQ